MIELHIETAPPQGISNPPLLVGSEQNKGKRLGLDGAEARNADLPLFEDSSSCASNSSPTLSTSSINNTQGLGLKSARKRGPAIKKSF